MIEINEKIKPKEIDGNVFSRTIKKLYRGYLIKWYEFKDKKPKLSEFIYKIFFFLFFSIGVTVVQYLLMTFLPKVFMGFGTEEWGWPMIPIQKFGGRSYIVLGDTNGFGYFLAFEIAVFVAQCLNFPLQRNITYKSHGNPVIQAIWYFIGWLLISFFMSALWGILNVILTYYNWPLAIVSLIKTMLTGFISMIIFFFIFMIIFPDYKKMIENEKKKLIRLKSKNKNTEVLEKKIEDLEKKHSEEKRIKEQKENKNRFEILALRYVSLVQKLDTIEEKEKTENKIKEIEKEALNVLDKIK